MAPPASAEELAYMEAHINQTLQPNLIVSTAVCMAAAYVAVALRFISRSVGNVSFGKDDFFLILAIVFASAFSLIMVSLTKLGFGRHIITLKKADGPPIGKAALAALVILPVATYCIKLSILFLYHRIFPTPRFTKSLKIVGTVTGAFCIASVLVTIFECLPVGAQLTGRPHKCFNLDAEYTALSFINAVFDWVVLALPMPMIWRLHTSTHRKFQLIGMFMLGAFACIASIARSAYSTQSSPIDTTYADARTAMWTTVEINISIVSACLPTMRPIFRRLVYGKDQTTPSYPAVKFSEDKATNRTQATEMDVFKDNGHDDDQKSFVYSRSGAASATNTDAASIEKATSIV